MPRPPGFVREDALGDIMRTFWAHGFEATSLDRLEQATGLGRQSLYNAFGGKEAMLQAALDAYREQIGGPLHALLEHEDPRTAVRAFLEGHLAIFGDPDTPAGCFIAGCSSELGPRDDAMGARLRAETAAGVAAAADRFRAWQAAGRLSPDADPDSLAALLAAISRGLATLSRASPDALVLSQAVDGAVAALSPFLIAADEAGGDAS
jgi:AcrR family transcriptional regulator